MQVTHQPRDSDVPEMGPLLHHHVNNNVECDDFECQTSFEQPLPEIVKIESEEFTQQWTPILSDKDVNTTQVEYNHTA